MRSRPLLDVDEIVTSDSMLSDIALAPECSSPLEEETRQQPSAKRRRYLKLQGEYVGHLRRLTPSQKERVKARRAEQGLEEAVALAKELGGVRAIAVPRRR